jgi:hypothetical protein
MPLMRFWPDAGTHCVTEIALRARFRKVSSPVSVKVFGSPPQITLFGVIALSIAMNHCGVLRKITGFFERQECGY